MGYHTKHDIPNYWTYAKHFVLQDRMFESTASWSLPAHLYMVSGWSARCENHNPFSCVGTGKIPPSNNYIFAWTDLTYLLHKNGVSWRYYVVKGLEPDCEDDETLSCVQHASRRRRRHLEPASLVRHGRRTASSATSSRSPASTRRRRGHPAGRLVDRAVEPRERAPVRRASAQGQSYVTSLINAVMRSPQWNSTAIFLAWDDWGGFYDHVVPPDGRPARIRHPRARDVDQPVRQEGYIDHQT